MKDREGKNRLTVEKEGEKEGEEGRGFNSQRPLSCNCCPSSLTRESRDSGHWALRPDPGSPVALHPVRRVR